jgi:outer membrane protein insertion porin family
VLDDEGIPTTVGYIPTVKVFRLEGSDNVRGYRNSEINTLSNGLDIAQVVVNDTAYYLNIKIEGRHYLKDNIVIYPFFDAGSIQVNHWVPFDLKTSVGIGIRYLTPMGSLELDFGVKTHRNAGESFGSVDLMIGYF